MNLSALDWGIIALFFIISMVIGLWSSGKSGANAKEYFLSGQNMPWWLLGVSMVATTFSADTPNLVTDIVRKNGVAGNWAWWAFLLTGMLTVFVYAKLWRRSGIFTDLEFYELRYSGKPASFLRGFRAIYLGVFLNVLIMATVLLAGIKIGSTMLGLSPIWCVSIVCVVTVIYSGLGGLKGVIMTDFFMFAVAMTGMIAASIYIVNLPQVGGLHALLTHPNVVGKLDFVPDLNNMEVAIPLFFIPLAVQWWSTWYPGAEPGGGGYIAQRMLSAKNEDESVLSTLFFNVAHYALRPWPWILIALASLVVFPDLDSIGAAFPNMTKSIIGDDIAFPAMLTLLPKGLIGLLIASLIAALMSTISTHLNWGSSYIVNDFYKRFIDKEVSDKKAVLIGQLSTVVLMIMAGTAALYLESAYKAFNILLLMGAGTGLLFILRWFWWRVNAYSEIAAMAASFICGLVLYYSNATSGWKDHEKLITGVLITTFIWVATTLLTRPTDVKTLKHFYTKIRPYNYGWKPVIVGLSKEELEELNSQSIPSLSKDILMMFLGCTFVYSALFGVGYLLYGKLHFTAIALGISVVVAYVFLRVWKTR